MSQLHLVQWISRIFLTDAPNPLVVPLESSKESKSRRTQLWFSRAGLQGILGGALGEKGEGEEEERAVRVFREKGGQVWEKEKDTDMKCEYHTWCTI